MHIEDLAPALSQMLRNAGTSITAKVMLTATTLEPNYSVQNIFLGTYGPAYARYRFDITNRVIEWPTITLEHSRWPDDSTFTVSATECSLRLTNTDRIMAVAQTDAILRPQDIEQAMVDVYANVGGTLVNWFSGRVVGRPTEKAGETILTVIGHVWDCIRKPVLYENFGSVSGHKQDVIGGDAGFFTDMVHIDCVGSHFCVHHGVVSFSGGGQPLPRVKRTAGTSISLLGLRLANKLKPGKYTIKFKSHAGYTLTCPGNVTYNGNRFRGMEIGSPIEIGKNDWTGDDGLGCEFEFYVSWTAKGNGIAMAYHLLEKGLFDNQGILPGVPSARIDAAAFTKLAKRFASFDIFVSETNIDNSVFDGDGKNRPLEYATLVQKILGHYQCSLTMLNDGTISITGPYMDDQPAWPHSTADAITGTGIELEGGETINFITVQFGGDPDGGFAAPIERNLNPLAAQKVEQVFSLPYIKVGSGNNFALWWERMITRRMMRNQTLVKYSVDPANGLLLAAGDKVTVVSNVLPVFRHEVQIIEVTRGILKDAQVTAAVIQDAEGKAAVIGSAVVGGVGVW